MNHETIDYKYLNDSCDEYNYELYIEYFVISKINEKYGKFNISDPEWPKIHRILCDISPRYKELIDDQVINEYNTPRGCTPLRVK
jgi:hypothetical protein